MTRTTSWNSPIGKAWSGMVIPELTARPWNEEAVLATCRLKPPAGYEKRKQHEEQEMGHFRPIAMSKASRTTRKFKRPATMRKLLPYS